MQQLYNAVQHKWVNCMEKHILINKRDERKNVKYTSAG